MALEDKKFQIEFLKNNQGLIKWGLIAILAVVGLVIAPTLWPLILGFIGNAIGTIVGLIELTAVGIVAAFLLKYTFDGTIPKLLTLILDNLAIRAKNAIIKSDPFSTAQNMIIRLEKRRDLMQSKVGDLKGAVTKLQKSIDTFTAKRQQAAAMAQTAEKEGNEIQEQSWARTAKQYNGSIERLTPLSNTAQALYKFQRKMLELVGANIEEQKRALSIAMEEYSIATTSKEAVDAARATMSGEDAQNFDTAMNAIAESTTKALGDVELFMDMTQPLLDAKDFANKAEGLQAMSEFKKWLSTDSSIMDAEQKRQFLAETGADTALFLSNGKTSPPRSSTPVATSSDDDGRNQSILDKYRVGQ